MAVEVVDSNAKIVTLVAAIIDESGSMQGVRAETIGGYNGFISDIQKEQEGKEAYVSTFLFDSTPGRLLVRTLQDTVALKNAVPLSEATYSPQGMTPLYDAIGTAIKAIDTAVAEKNINRVTLLIQTDGAENSSREYSHAAITALIKERTDAGWQIIFLGADLANATQMGASLGVVASNSMAYSKGMTTETFSAMSAGTQAYRSNLYASVENTLSDSEKSFLAGDLNVVPNVAPHATPNLGGAAVMPTWTGVDPTTGITLPTLGVATVVPPLTTSTTTTTVVPPKADSSK